MESIPEVSLAIFGLGPLEIGVIVVFGLVLFGPKRLPGLGKSMGEAIKGFKKGLNEEEKEIDVTDSVKKEQIDEKEKT
jgi:sec-independent protein translocase protein TatA